MSVDISFRHSFADFALDIDFSAPARGITALFGPSGSGKTSVLNAIAGLLRPEHGRIAIAERTLMDSSTRTWMPPRLRRIAYVFQDDRLFPHLNVDRNLRFGWRRSQTRCPDSHVGAIVEMLGLSRLLHRKPKDLSGGERARVALGRALLCDPKLLLLDEPLASVDAARKNEILPYLERLRDVARIPMLFVSHSVDEMMRVADHLVVLRHGRVVACGALFEICSNLSCADFLGDAPYGAVFATEVKQHLPAEALTILAFAGGEITVPLLAKPLRRKLRTHIRASDILIAREAPRAISANNILPAVISEMRQSAPCHVDVRLLCGETALVARITRASAERLRLRAQLQVFAIVKSVSIGPRTADEN